MSTILETSGNTLADRIHACVPVTGQAYAKLLGLLSVEASDSVPTACVTTGARSRLIVNPEFVARHCRTDEHLAMLVLHELYHVLLGHTRLYRRVSRAQNWAFDCLINAQLCRLFPHPRHTGFFRQFSDQATGPAALLGPPDGWNPQLDACGRTPCSPGGSDAAGLLLTDTHWRLYADESVSTEELYRLLERAVAGVDNELDGLPLLGNHDPETGEGDTLLHPEAMREVREIVARWPMLDRRRGRDQGERLSEDQIALGTRRNQAVRVLRQALARAADEPGGGSATRLGAGEQPSFLPWDSGHDRRASVQQLLGAEPLLWGASNIVRQRVPAERVRVYLDVSGSMHDVLPALYAALAGCLDQVEPVVHVFSTRIAVLTHAQLRAGIRLGTGGTEIAAVTAHLLGETGSGARPGRQARRALIVTDGGVGEIPEGHRRAFARGRARLAVVITHDGDDSFAQSIGAPVFRLPVLS